MLKLGDLSLQANDPSSVTSLILEINLLTFVCVLSLLSFP